MKTLSAMTAIGTVLLMFASGCGGGGGNGSSATRSIAGAWTGAATSSVGSSNLNVQYIQSGSALIGTTMLTEGGTTYIGSLTGTINGNSITTTVDYTRSYTGNFGIEFGTLTLSGNTISGSLDRAKNGVVVETSTTLLTKSTVATPNIAGTYTGGYGSSGAGQTSLSLTISGSGNNLNIQGIQGTLSVIGNAAIIGDNFSGILTLGPSSLPLSMVTVYLTGTVSGNAISGTSVQTTNGVAPQNGTFTFTASQ